MTGPSNLDAGQARRCGVTLRDLTVNYRERIAVEAVSGIFVPGSLTAIVGANGAGKTTLLHAIAGLGPHPNCWVRSFATLVHGACLSGSSIERRRPNDLAGPAFRKNAGLA